MTQRRCELQIVLQRGRSPAQDLKWHMVWMMLCWTATGLMRTRCECQQPVKTGLAPDHELQRHRGWVGLVCTALHQHQRWKKQVSFVFHQLSACICLQRRQRKRGGGATRTTTQAQVGTKKKYRVHVNINRSAVCEMYRVRGLEVIAWAT